MKKAIVICGFPGVGKTMVANNRSNILDAESTAFHWIFDPVTPESMVRNPAFPQNYRAYLQENSLRYDFILSATHKEVRDELKRRQEKYIIVAPKRELKNEYLIRYLRRGSDIKFIELLNEKWDEFITDIENDGAPVIWLDAGRTLADIISDIP